MDETSFPPVLPPKDDSHDSFTLEKFTQKKKKGPFMTNWFSSKKNASPSTLAEAPQVVRQRPSGNVNDDSLNKTLNLSISSISLNTNSLNASTATVSKSLENTAPALPLFPELSLAIARQFPIIHANRLPSLHKATYTGDLKKVKSLISKMDTFNVDTRDSLHGLSALHLAVEMDNSLIVKELLGLSEDPETRVISTRANPNVLDMNLRTPLLMVNFSLTEQSVFI